jgi:hypothetical protein
MTRLVRMFFKFHVIASVHHSMTRGPAVPRHRGGTTSWPKRVIERSTMS